MIKCYKAGDFSSVFEKITANILDRRQKRGGDSFSESLHEQQHRCMNLPKTDDNDRTYENDINTLSWLMVNASFPTRAS